MKQKKVLLAVIGVVVLAVIVRFFGFKKASAPTSYLGKTVSVDYVGTYPDGKMFDTNIQDVAQKNGLYAAGSSNKYVPLQFTIGSGQVVAGFEAAINGMKIGETKRVTLQPKDAYGEYDNTKLANIDRAAFDDAKMTITTGQVYQYNNELIKVLQVGTKTLVIDRNHPMAGKTLIFDITLKAVK